MRESKNRARILYICRAGLVAALYTALTVTVGALGLSGGPVQLRLSEALCILPVFTPAAVPGLAVGCLAANLFTGCIWQDVVFGTLATLIGAIGARLLRHIRWLSPLPTVVANTAVIPFVLAYGYRAEAGLPFLIMTVGIGELLSAYLCGMVLLTALRPHAARLF